ncbi:MAG TPA: TIGR00730 family Rossman fold protein [Fulvivirga sp.]|nr:TIGR00730 family Rossman fold protein [Fulvivirga sp.]
MNNICVFCGSNVGNDIAYEKGAKSLGFELSQKNIHLVYGGGRVGLMGIIADEVLSQKGQVIGVIPKFLIQKEVDHKNLTELHVVQSMHERKQMMASLSDAFIAMPGGLGTLEELAEMLTWVQLEIIKKPIGLFNINGFFDSLILQLNHMTKEGFLNIETRKNLVVSDNPKSLVDMISNFQFSSHSIWDDLNKT